MIWIVLINITVLVAVDSFHFNIVPLKQLRQVHLYHKFKSTDHLNDWHCREAALEFIQTNNFPKGEPSEALEAKIKNWTMPCYLLDANMMPVPTNCTKPFTLPLRRGWVLSKDYEVSTTFLGVDHRFGRLDQGDEPMLFETIAFSPERISLPYRTATYEETEKMHHEVCQLVENKRMNDVGFGKEKRKSQLIYIKGCS